MALRRVLHLALLEQEERRENRANREHNPRYHMRYQQIHHFGDIEFKRQFGFSKQHVDRLEAIFGPDLRPLRGDTGNPISPRDKILAFLAHCKSGNIIRSTANSAGISKNGILISVHKVIDAICSKKREFIRLPNILECAIISEQNFRKKGLRNVVLSVDGKLFDLFNRPRENEQGEVLTKMRLSFDEEEADPTDDIRAPVSKDYYTYKRHYALNVMIIGDGTLIREVYADSPGSFHDSHIYGGSQFKSRWESPEFRPYILLGDAGYPPSTGMAVPYKENQRQTDFTLEQIGKYHKSLSSIRTTQTESMFGRLVKVFPCLKSLRHYYIDVSTKLVIACCVLFNIREHLLSEEEDEDEITTEEKEEYMRCHELAKEHFEAWMRANKATGRHMRRGAGQEGWLTREYLITTMVRR